MRILKLFVAVVLLMLSLRAGAADFTSENRLVTDSAINAADFAPVSAFSSAVTSSEDLAALRLSPAVAGGTPLTGTVTLPQASPVPEPTAMIVVTAGVLVLRRRSRQVA